MVRVMGWGGRETQVKNTTWGAEIISNLKPSIQVNLNLTYIRSLAHRTLNAIIQNEWLVYETVTVSEKDKTFDVICLDLDLKLSCFIFYWVPIIYYILNYGQRLCESYEGESNRNSLLKGLMIWMEYKVCTFTYDIK